MKRLISIVSWLALMASVIIVYAVLSGSVSKTRATKSALPAQNTIVAAFSGFPLDQSKLVLFDAHDENFSELSDRERADQVRDWLIFAIAADCGVDTENLNRCLFDVVPIRHGYLRPVARFEYGQTRHFSFRDGEVVALIPRTDEQQRIYYLSHIFDDSRKSLGTIPRRLYVFEYELRGTEAAEVTRRAPIEGEAFLNASLGYYQSLVKSKSDLDAFLDNTDDIVSAILEADGLRLAGRRSGNTPSSKISATDVAAIWQACEEIQKKLRRLGEQEEAFDSKWQTKFDDFKHRWSGQGQNHQSESAWAAFKAQHDAEAAQLKEKLQIEYQKQRMTTGSGFSLDPSYDFRGLVTILSKPTFSAFLDSAGVSKEKASSLLLEAWTRYMTTADSATPGSRDATLTGEVDLAGLSLPAVLKLAGIDSQDLKGAIQSLSKDNPNIVPFLAMVDKVNKASSENSGFKNALREIFEYLQQKYGFQIARYDGPLNGTEVGMTLFYTDLLAKLWALDYMKTTPSQRISDFEPLTRVSVSPIYDEESRELSNTRLWFGAEDGGYQAVDSKRLFFAPTATRVYAASSNPLTPGAEAAPNAESEAFLGWWNDHYEEVAQYEPEYQRLNEIMKWSLVISWLDNAGSRDSLSFLADVRVDKSAWFPDWVHASPQLRFSAWDKIGFFKRGWLGTSTEALPMLSSERVTGIQPFYQYVGGVSLGSKDLFDARLPLASRVPAAMRRAELDYGKISEDANELLTLRGTQYDFMERISGSRTFFEGAAPHEISGVKIKGLDTWKYRNGSGEIAEGNFERTIVRNGEDITVSVRSTAGEIGALHIEKSSNGFRVGWHAREMDDAFTLCQRLSGSGDLAAAIRKESMIEFAAQDVHTNQYFIKMPGTKRWMKLALEGAPRENIAEGWAARVADIKPDSQRLVFAWVDETNVPSNIWQQNRWARGPPPKGPTRPTISGEFEDFGGDKKKFAKLASEVEHDPIGFKKRYEENLKTRVREIDDLLERRSAGKALDTLDDALMWYGERPELLLRKALAELDINNSSAAADTINKAGITSRSEAEEFLDEINARLQTAQAGEQNLLKCAELIDWRTSVVKSNKDKILLTSDDKTGVLHLEAHLVDPPDGTLLESSSGYKGEPLYYQDSPSLNNLDWNASTSAALDQTFSNQLGDVIQLSRADLAHFNPTIIYVGETQFKLATKTIHAPLTKISFYQRWALPQPSTPNSSPGGNDDDRGGTITQEKPGYVYVVVANPRTAEVVRTPNLLPDQ
jgi:hypothetical protein